MAEDPSPPDNEGASEPEDDGQADAEDGQVEPDEDPGAGGVEPEADSERAEATEERADAADERPVVADVPTSGSAEDEEVPSSGAEGIAAAADDGSGGEERSTTAPDESEAPSESSEAASPSGGESEEETAPTDSGEAGPSPAGDEAEERPEDAQRDVPPDVRKYQRFTKVDGAQYERVNDFLRERTYVTAREWAIARLCADFRTETGVEMTKIGENLDELVPFMEDSYSPQAVNQARSSFEEKVRKAGATFLYGAMCDFFTAEELDELMYEVTEVAKFLLEVEGVDLSVEDELAAEDRISGVMREVREASEALRYEECPHCGESLKD